MRTKKGRFIRSLSAAAMVLTLGIAHAAFPEKPLQLIVPFPPGGAADVAARLVAVKLGGELGQPVVVNNRPGAGTIVAAQAAARSAPDGYTLFLASNSSLTINPAIRHDLKYDPVQDFELVGAMGTIPMMVAVPANSPIHTLADLVAAASKDPDRYPYASYGAGTPAHFAGELLKLRANLRMEHIAYRGSAPAMNDLIGGQVPVAFDTVVAAKPQAAAHKIRVLAVTVPERTRSFPNVPTIAESGFPGFDISSWIVLVTPRGLADEVAVRLRSAFDAAAADAELQRRLSEAGFEPMALDPADWSRFLKDEIATMQSIAQQADIRPE